MLIVLIFVLLVMSVYALLLIFSKILGVILEFFTSRAQGYTSDIKQNLREIKICILAVAFNIGIIGIVSLFLF